MSFFTLLVLPLLLLNTASALQCYSCAASVGNGFRCENLSLSGPNIPYSTCFYDDAVCAKYVVEYGDSLMVHRSCQHADICRVLASKFENNFYSKLIECQTCSDQNYCNRGVTVTKISHVAIFSVLLVVLVQLLL